MNYITTPVDERLPCTSIIYLIKNSVKMKAVIGKKTLSNSLVPKAPCINLDYLAGKTKSHPKLMVEMIALYLQQTPILVSMMTKSFEEKDWETLNATLHKMIPSFTIVGISADFTNMAKSVKDYVGVPSQIEKIPELLTRLESVCNQACTELQQELINLKNTGDEK